MTINMVMVKIGRTPDTATTTDGTNQSQSRRPFILNLIRFSVGFYQFEIYPKKLLRFRVQRWRI